MRTCLLLIGFGVAELTLLWAGETAGKLPGDEGSGGKKKFIIFSTQKPLLPPPPAGTDRGKADKWKLVDNLAIGEARHLNALVVFNKEIIYGYRCAADPSPRTTPCRAVRSPAWGGAGTERAAV